MKQTLKLVRNTGLQSQKMQLVGAHRFRHQAVAAALNMNQMGTTRISHNSLFATPARFFAASTQQVPTMGDSISEGVIEAYVKNVGEFVQADEIIARIETDKVTVDILSEHTGVITKYHSEVGDTVPVGAQFVDIDPDAKPSATPAPEAKKEAAPTPAAATPEPVKAAEPKKEAPPTPAAPQQVQPAASSS